MEATTSAKIGAHVPPTILPPNFEGMPNELKQIKNWVVWRYLPPKTNGGKWRKVPFQPNGRPASTTDRTTWSGFEECSAAYATGSFSGVGFVFDGEPDEDGLVYAGVDFDSGAFEQDCSIRAVEWADRFGSYIETSVSGQGRHVILKAPPLASGISHAGIELYTSGRYFTMTGCTGGVVKPIIAAPSVFAALANELHASSDSSIDGRTSKLPTPTSNVVPFKLPEWALIQRPAAAFAHLSVQPQTDGLEPNIEKIRSAVDAIPPSAIETEPEWMKLARALAHEAAVFEDLVDPLWAILDTASRRAPRYDQEDNRRRWERYISDALKNENPITIASVFGLARKHGWQGWPAANTAPTAPLLSAASNSPRAVPVASLPLVPPKRLWLHGTDLMRGAVSMLVAPGGKAKSTWLLTCGLACASGRPLLGAHVFGGPLRVLYISAEDPINEIALRLRAAMQHHGLSNADVASYHVIGGESWGLWLLRAAGAAPVIDERGWNALNAELDRIQPDVLIIDPLINFMGGVDANDNSAAALLMGQLAALAARRRMAIMVAHHAAKGRDPKSAESAMGAASFVNLCRIALGIESLAASDAGRVGLPHWDTNSVFRVLGTKQNFSPPSTDDRWYRTLSVEIQNQQKPTYPNGDKVAVVETFTPGTSGPAYPDGLIRSALEAIDLASPPLSNMGQSKTRYAAPVVASAIAPHRGGMASELDGKAIVDHLIGSGLVEVQSIKVPRPGKGADDRKGLVLTPAGRAFVLQVAQAPQSPQTTAVVSAGTAVCAGGDQPCGSPAPLGGCGGKCGG